MVDLDPGAIGASRIWPLDVLRSGEHASIGGPRFADFQSAAFWVGISYDQRITTLTVGAATVVSVR